MSSAAGNPNEGHDFWQTQLADIDFSVLAEEELSPEDEPEQISSIIPYEDKYAVTPHHTSLIMVMLNNMLRQVKADPALIHSAMLICRLSDGRFRIVFPHSYDRESLKEFSDAASYFNTIIGEEEENA
jgi:hypothetical protein